MNSGSRTKHAQKQAPYLLKELDRVADIASFFGFTPIKTPDITKEDVSKASSFKSGSARTLNEEQEGLTATPEEKIALLRTYLENDMASLPHPLMLYYRKPFGGLSARKRSTLFQCGLDIIGTANSVAEALVIKTLCAILTEQGFGDLSIDINTLGDKDSAARFDRELASYIRKHVGEMSPELRAAVKKDPLELLRWIDERDARVCEHAPKPMGFLSEPSIQHFKEVLEYLETLNIPYRINDRLISDRSYCSHTIFEIRGTGGPRKEQESVLLATGCRHNYISKKVGFKKDIPMMSGTICFKKTPDMVLKITVRKIQRPKFYFIQLGFKARLKSLIIIDTLRKARIPVYHALTKEKLVNQLATAEHVKPSHLIIMGQKEALDDTVVIRHIDTRAQDIVSLAELSRYLQRLK